MTIAAPRRIKATSNTGKPKAAYVFRMLELRGYQPFAPLTFGDGRIEKDLRGHPITRQIVDGELQDVIWWHGPVSADVCVGCGLADGARPVVRMTRRARVRGTDRVPTVKSAGIWHLSCLRVRMQNYGRNGRDTRQTATNQPVVMAAPVAPEPAYSADIRTRVTSERPPVDTNAELRMAWVRFVANRKAYLKGMGGFRVS